MSAPTVLRKKTSQVVSLNDATGLRRKIGNALRSLATRFDGRHSLAFEIQSDPPLTAQQQHECVRHSFKALSAAVAAECAEEALEDALREAKPRLYESAKQERSA